jgi:hypothetical protein
MRKSTKLILYGIPATLLLSCGGGLLGFAYKSRTDRDRAVARLAEVGLPTDPDQIKHIPNSTKDAGELLKQFGSAFVKARKAPAGLAFFNSRKSDVSQARSFVRANPDLVRLRKILFTKAELATQLEPKLGHEQPFPVLEAIRNLVLLALAETQILTADGDPARAIDLCTQTAQFVELLSTDPNHLAELVQSSSRASIIKRVAEIFAGSADRLDVRASVRKYLLANASPADHRRAMIADVSDALALELKVREGKLQIPALMESIGPIPSDPKEKALLNMYRVQGASDMLFARLYEGYADLYVRIPPDLTRHKDRIEAAARWNMVTTDVTGPNSFLLKNLVQNYVICFEFEAKQRAEWRTLNALLAASEIKAKTGRYPTSLPVTGQDAIDPYTEQPLKYLLTNGSLTIYSVGDDLSDDKGKLFRLNYLAMPGSSPPPLDIGFSIPGDVQNR